MVQVLETGLAAESADNWSWYAVLDSPMLTPDIKAAPFRTLRYPDTLRESPTVTAPPKAASRAWMLLRTANVPVSIPPASSCWK